MSAPRRCPLRNRVLQSGYPNSGNYLTYRVLDALQRGAGVARSVRVESGLGAYIRASLPADTFAFPEEPDVDYVRRGEIQTPTRRVPGDLALLHESASLIWTHDRPEEVDVFAPANERRRVYLLRDGRDAVTSQLYRLTSDRERRIHPVYTIADPAELASVPGFFERLVHGWRRHVEEVLDRRDGYVVRYERLCADKEAEVRRLAGYLELDLRPETLEQILHETSPEVARSHAAAHVRRALPAGHKKLFTPTMHAIFEELAGEVQRSAGYPVKSAASTPG